MRVGDLIVDLDRLRVTRDGAAIELPDLTFRLLATLIRHAPERVSKDQLIAEVWGDVVVSDETLAQRGSLLRHALGDDSQNPRYLQSVRGRGYRLIPDVRSENVRPAKRIGTLAVGAALILLGLVVAMRWSANVAHETNDSSIAMQALAVLPFEDISKDQDKQYFADGMHEELLQRLSSVDDLPLISRTSVEPYRQSTLGLRDIARQLGAGAVLEGSVRIDDDRLRITVQLIDAASDEHVWSQSYDREMSVQSIFETQADVADRIARALQLQYSTKDSNEDALPTDDLVAYNQYLLGRYHTFQQTPANLALAIKFLSRAIEIDNQFAEAWATLGWAYSFQGTAYGQERPHDVYPKAKEAALRALALDAELADARSLYADILAWYDWDFAAAEREYRHTIELDPLNVLGYALFLSTQQRHTEAIQLVNRRLAADPDDPYVGINVGWRYFHAAQFDDAVALAQESEQHPDATTLLGWSLLGRGDADKAIDVFSADIEVNGREARRVSNLAAAHFYAGQEDAARGLMEELQSQAADSYVPAMILAPLHFLAGEPDEGFAQLSEAVAQHDRGVIFLPVALPFADYREDPRYKALVRQIGFTN